MSRLPTKGTYLLLRKEKLPGSSEGEGEGRGNVKRDASLRPSLEFLFLGGEKTSSTVWGKKREALSRLKTTLLLGGTFYR